MSSWLRLVGRIVKDGAREGELSPEADPREMASVVVGTLEGAMMLSKLFDDPQHMERAVVHLKRHLSHLAKPGVRQRADEQRADERARGERRRTDG